MISIDVSPSDAPNKERGLLPCIAIPRPKQRKTCMSCRFIQMATRFVASREINRILFSNLPGKPTFKLGLSMCKCVNVRTDRALRK
jgi:hypothetical protein